MNAATPKSNAVRATLGGRRQRLLAVAFVVLMAGCASDAGGDTGNDGGDQGGTGATEAPAADTSTDDSSGAADTDDAAVNPTVSIEPSDYITIAAELTVVSDDAVRLDVTATSDEHVVELPRTATASTEHSIPVVGLRAGREYTIDISLVDDAGTVVGTEVTTFVTGDLPDDFVDYEFSADPERSSPGYTLLEITRDGTPYLLALDVDGEVVWYYRNTGVVGGVEPTERGTFLSHYWPVGVREFDLLGNVVGNWQ
ncbi:MAG: aryl-sulfate sulfotransferase N-terminal domain-containing protein, partial [Acidimicrobiia bacterium]|nr:aryl-sulfate sulfotransferase N-terminal domain-containing protein [Acidimicrobiia bacterium]